jgi:hypothetical protein
MVRLIQTLALGAALVALITCIWRDYGILAALPRVAIAYLATFFVGAAFALGGRVLGDAVARPAAPVATSAARPPVRKRREKAPLPVTVEAAAPTGGAAGAES